MKIHNPDGLKTIDYRTVKPLQGNLKDLETEEHDKLLSVLNKRGFKGCAYVWFDKDGQPYWTDGHQRDRVMRLNELRDETLKGDDQYKIPYVTIEAADRKTAVEQLLEFTSQYGHVTREGLDELTAEYDLEPDDMDINFDAIADFDMPTDEEDEPKAETKKGSWTIKELRAERDSFSEATGSGDNGFVGWLEDNRAR